MKDKLLVFIMILIITGLKSFGQHLKIPKDISHAVALLKAETSDSLKNIVKKTDDRSLGELVYPYGHHFKTIYNWLTNDKTPVIKKYFLKKGISDNYHQKLIILKVFKESLLGFKTDENEMLRPYQILERKWAEEDKIKYSVDTLRGVYIPKNLEDCFRKIDEFWSDSTKNKMKNLSEDNFIGRVHLGFGMWIRNNWQLWRGSRLTKYFNDKGVSNAESISGIILISYHRYLNNKPIMLDKQIQSDKDYWKKSDEEDIAERRKEFTNYKVGDTLLFKYNFGYSSKEQEDKFEKNICVAKGLLLEKNEINFLVRIRILESCDSKGIIYYNSENVLEYNKRTKIWQKPIKRIKKSIKNKQEYWFLYNNWRVNN